MCLVDRIDVVIHGTVYVTLLSGLFEDVRSIKYLVSGASIVFLLSSRCGIQVYNDIIELSSRHAILLKFDTIWCHDTLISIPFDPALMAHVKSTVCTAALESLGDG